MQSQRCLASFLAASSHIPQLIISLIYFWATLAVFCFFFKNICVLFFFLSYLKGKIHSVLYLIFSCLKICPKGQLMLDMESFFILFYRCKACHYIFQLVSNDGYLSCFRFSAVTDKSTVMALCICYFYMWKEQQSSVTAVTHNSKCNSLQWYKFIVIQFWRVEV